MARRIIFRFALVAWIASMASGHSAILDILAAILLAASIVLTAIASRSLLLAPARKFACFLLNRLGLNEAGYTLAACLPHLSARGRRAQHLRRQGPCDYYSGSQIQRDSDAGAPR